MPGQEALTQQPWVPDEYTRPPDYGPSDSNVPPYPYAEHGHRPTTALGEVNHRLHMLHSALASRGANEEVSFARDHMAAAAEAVRATNGEHTAEELYGCLHIANEIDRLTGGRAEAWRLLGGAEPGKVKELVEYDYDTTALMETLLRRGAASPDTYQQPETVGQFIVASEHVYTSIRGQEGYCQFWLKNGTLAAPNYMRPIVESPDFIPYAIWSHAEHVRELNVIERDRQLATFERHMMVRMFKFPERQADDFQFAFRQRVMATHVDPVTNERLITGYDEGGGTDVEAWVERLSLYASRVHSVGTRMAWRMYDELGVVNLDTLDESDVRSAQMLLAGDGRLRQQIGKKDFVVTVRDKAGSTVDGFAMPSRYVAAAVSQEGSIPIPLEANDVDEALTRLDLLSERYGVRAAKVILLQHGQPWGLFYGTSKWPNPLPKQDMHARGLGEQIAARMTPSIHTKDKMLLLLACDQATVAGEASNREDSEGTIREFFSGADPDLSRMSPAHVLASTTPPEQNLTVVAAKGKVTAQPDDSGRLRFTNGDDWALATLYRRNRRGNVQSEAVSHIPLGNRGRPAA